MVLCDDYPYPIYIEEANVKFVLLCSLRLCRNIPKSVADSDKNEGGVTDTSNRRRRLQRPPKEWVYLLIIEKLLIQSIMPLFLVS